MSTFSGPYSRGRCSYIVQGRANGYGRRAWQQTAATATATTCTATAATATATAAAAAVVDCQVTQVTYTFRSIRRTNFKYDNNHKVKAPWGEITLNV